MSWWIDNSPSSCLRAQITSSQERETERLGGGERETEIRIHLSFSLSLSDLLEESPFLSKTLPWGPMSVLVMSDRSKSDDGPILWVRPGEQLIPTAEMPTPHKKRRRFAHWHYCLWFHIKRSLCVCVCVYFKSGLYDFAFKLCEHSDLQWFEVCNLWFS